MSGKNFPKVCFVIMGFGKKTDYRTGRAINLDATYNEIIKPVTEELGISCIRADEVCHSGSIDKEMYRLLLSADIVIADISTNNANAIYELGVRHALKKSTTIIMAEKTDILHFDLNHIATIQYEHLGEDIGCSEARKIRTKLKELIFTTLNESKTDSPVYTFLPDLNMPFLSEKEIHKLVEDSYEVEKEWSNVFDAAETSLKEGDFFTAKEYYSRALSLRPNDDYLIQRLTLCTYKDPTKSKTMACMDAMIMLSTLIPEESNDPETTGLAGAINKNIWEESKNIEFLDKAIAFYNRGFSIKRDYYNGENLAYCFYQKATTYGSKTRLIEKELNEKIFNEVSAEKTYSQVLEITEYLIDSDDFSERTDQKWVAASAAKASDFLGFEQKCRKYRELFRSLNDNSWDEETFEKNTIQRSIE